MGDLTIPPGWEEKKYNHAIACLTEALKNNKVSAAPPELLQQLAIDLFNKFTNFQFTVNDKTHDYVLDDIYKNNDLKIKQFAITIARSATSSYRADETLTEYSVVKEIQPITLTPDSIMKISNAMQSNSVPSFVRADAQTFSTDFCAKTHYTADTLSCIMTHDQLNKQHVDINKNYLEIREKQKKAPALLKELPNY